MKKIFLAPIFACTSYLSGAQATFSTMDSVDVNNIRASVLVHGDFWWNPVEQIAFCQYPPGSPKNANFASALWLSGYDLAGNLHIAAQTYRQSGNDYWPGPLDSGDTLTYTTSHDWAKIWKVNSWEIQAFFEDTPHTLVNTPTDILYWPGNGNIYAQGNGGIALSITSNMAPFVDLNGNGIYEPLLGEYPDFNGDQALWWVFSDNGPTHTQTNGKPLGVEVHAMAYAYKRNTLIDNVIYYDFNILNKSLTTYNNFRFSLFDDVDLGYFLDDYIGFDSTYRMGIGYNGLEDDGITGGHPANSYGTHIPIVGVTLIDLPGDVGTNYVPVGSFSYFNNDNSVLGNPSVDTQFNNYMRAKIRNGVHFKNDYDGPGVPSPGYLTGPDVNYVYPGNPQDSTQWSECASRNNPGDRRFILASNDNTFVTGASEHVVMALLVTDSNAGGCPTASFDSIRALADTAWHIYHNPLNPLPPSGIKYVGNASGLKIYPNPVENVLYIQSPAIPGDGHITIYNTLGQLMPVEFALSNGKGQADVSQLLPGLYELLFDNANFHASTTFLKE